MLRITLLDEPIALRVTVEGELTGQQAEVLEANWRNAAPHRAARNVLVDLGGVTAVDAVGKAVLGLMLDDGAELSARGPKMTHLIETLRAARDRSLA